MADLLQTVFMIFLFITAIFLIVLVLIQRGKGGGLAGAFGGMGGQSAFGTKAGDLFTRITIGVAAFWIVLCIFTVKFLGAGGGDDLIDGNLGSADRQGNTVSVPVDDQDNAAPAPDAPPGGPGQEDPSQP